MTKLVSSISDLHNAVGRKIRVNRAFCGVKVGQTGRIVKFYSIGPEHQGVMVEWDELNGLQDGFGREPSYDETVWLELI